MQTQVAYENKSILQLSMLGLPGNRLIPENYDKAKTTKKYLKTKSLLKELQFFCLEARKERLSCMLETV